MKITMLIRCSEDVLISCLEVSLQTTFKKSIIFLSTLSSSLINYDLAVNNSDMAILKDGTNHHFNQILCGRRVNNKLT
jgi:hypothetical protein